MKLPAKYIAILLYLGTKQLSDVSIKIAGYIKTNLNPAVIFAEGQNSLRQIICPNSWMGIFITKSKVAIKIFLSIIVYSPVFK